MQKRCTISIGLALLIGTTAMAAPARRSTPDNNPIRLVQAQQSEPRKTFNGVGIVTAIQPAGKLTINHQAIQGLMPAMEMMFAVKPVALAKDIRPGDEVEFAVEGKTYTIVSLKVTGHAR